jgi:hypothetical protein
MLTPTIQSPARQLPFRAIWFIFLLAAHTVTFSQPYISADTPPSCYEIEARVRNGNAEFEAAIYTPNTPSPYDPGSKKWQLNPAGTPAWNTNGNHYGDLHTFRYTYEATTGTSVWNIDFNRDGDYTDFKESVINVAPVLAGKGFQYISILGQGNDFGKTATIHHLNINGWDFGTYSSSSNTPFSILFEDSTGIFNQIIVTGEFIFSGQGTPERPRIWVRLGESNIPPTCQLTNPLNGSAFHQDGSIELKATATDPYGKIVKVEFYDGHEKIGEDLKSPYSFLYIHPAVGSRQLRAKAIDHHEGMAFSNTVTVTVTGPPTIHIVTPRDNELLFDPDTLQMEAAISNDSIYTVDFYLDDVLIGSDDIAPYTNLSLLNLPMGPYSLQAKVVPVHGAPFESTIIHVTLRCIREDVNNDGVVNTFDFLDFLGAFGSHCINGCAADFNDDFEVNTFDFLRLLTKLGYSCL